MLDLTPLILTDSDSRDVMVMMMFSSSFSYMSTITSPVISRKQLAYDNAQLSDDRQEDKLDEGPRHK